MRVFVCLIVRKLLKKELNPPLQLILVNPIIQSLKLFKFCTTKQNRAGIHQDNLSSLRLSSSFQRNDPIVKNCRIPALNFLLHSTYTIFCLFCIFEFALVTFRIFQCKVFILISLSLSCRISISMRCITLQNRL